MSGESKRTAKTVLGAIVTRADVENAVESVFISDSGMPGDVLLMAKRLESGALTSLQFLDKADVVGILCVHLGIKE